MNDLISRSALISDISEIETNKVFDDKEDILEKVLARIDYQPIVDAKPVVHGKWKRQTDYDENDNAVFECTNCMHGDVHARSAIVPFCWYCGARMGGE